MVESSFATQYGIRFDEICNMSWNEFSTLLSGIMYKTPLGQIVSIRAEENEDMLKNFTKEQKEIRDSWRMKHCAVENMTDEEKAKKIQEFQNLLAKTFS